jgi:hypothetical protein
MGQSRSFTCVIEDKKRQEKFSAKVTVTKKEKVRPSLQAGQIDLADVFIEPVSGTHFFYMKGSWMKEQAAFVINGKLKKGVHNHFVIHDASGRGVYIVRDQYRRDIEKRAATIFDLGSAFATKVQGILREFA